jgi:hypothetical protein
MASGTVQAGRVGGDERHQLRNSDRTMDDQNVVLGGEPGGVVGRVAHDDQAATVARPDPGDRGRLRARGKVHHDRVDVGVEPRGPLLELVQLGDLAIRLQQGAEGSRKQGSSAEECNVAGHRLRQEPGTAR